MKQLFVIFLVLLFSLNAQASECTKTSMVNCPGKQAIPMYRVLDACWFNKDDREMRSEYEYKDMCYKEYLKEIEKLECSCEENYMIIPEEKFEEAQRLKDSCHAMGGEKVYCPNAKRVDTFHHFVLDCMKNVEAQTGYVASFQECENATLNNMMADGCVCK